MSPLPFCNHSDVLLLSYGVFARTRPATTRTAKLYEIGTNDDNRRPETCGRKHSSIYPKSSFHNLPTLELTSTTEGRPPSRVGNQLESSLPSQTSSTFCTIQAALVARISEPRAHAFLSFPAPSSLLRGFRQVFGGRCEAELRDAPPDC